MYKQKLSLCLLVFLHALNLSAYQIEGGDAFLGAGMGVNINVVRYDVENKATPRAQLPLIVAYDYAIDQHFGVFGLFSPHFAAGSIGLLFGAGAKYWFSYFDTPLVPFVSLALKPAFLLQSGVGSNHSNIGLSPGIGANFFILAKFLAGAHVDFNPSLAFVGDDKKFEFSVGAYLDLTFKI